MESIEKPPFEPLVMLTCIPKEWEMISGSPESWNARKLLKDLLGLPPYGAPAFFERAHSRAFAALSCAPPMLNAFLAAELVDGARWCPALSVRGLLRWALRRFEATELDPDAEAAVLEAVARWQAGAPPPVTRPARFDADPSPFQTVLAAAYAPGGGPLPAFLAYAGPPTAGEWRALSGVMIAKVQPLGILAAPPVARAALRVRAAHLLGVQEDRYCADVLGALPLVPALRAQPWEAPNWPYPLPPRTVEQVLRALLVCP